jgi:group I intron endonuclease
MKQDNLVIPIITYSNAERDKSVIYKENKNKCGVYKWTNLVTGESYVGSSISLTKRFRDYYKESKRLVIYNAILKHGYNNFSLDILEYCCPNKVIEREQYYIDLLKPEYNILKMAGSCLGYKHTKETKKLLSDKLKGREHSIEFKLNQSKTRRGIKHKPYNKSSKNINRVLKDETKLKLSLNVKGVGVKIFDRSNNLIKEFPTMTSAANYLGVHRKTINRIYETGHSYDDFIYKFEVKDNRI